MMNVRKLCVLGVGDAGIKSSQILSEAGIRAIFLGIGNSRRVLEGINVVHFESPKKELIPGVRKFLVPDLSHEALLPPDVEALLKSNFHFLLFAGLGGFTGTKITSAIITKLIETSKSFTCIVSYPFYFEGRTRSQNADWFASQYRNHPNIKILKLDDLKKHGNLLLSQALVFANLSLAELANKELQLGLKIELPQLIKPSLKSQIRTKHLEALREEIKNW